MQKCLGQIKFYFHFLILNGLFQDIWKIVHFCIRLICDIKKCMSYRCEHCVYYIEVRYSEVPNKRICTIIFLGEIFHSILAYSGMYDYFFRCSSTLYESNSGLYNYWHEKCSQKTPIFRLSNTIFCVEIVTSAILDVHSKQETGNKLMPRAA